VFHQEDDRVGDGVFVHFDDVVNPFFDDWFGDGAWSFYGDAVGEREYLALGEGVVNEWCTDGCLNANDLYVWSLVFDGKCGSGKQAAAAEWNDE
jgi:hypothetical protein